MFVIVTGYALSDARVTDSDTVLVKVAENRRYTTNDGEVRNEREDYNVWVRPSNGLHGYARGVKQGDFVVIVGQGSMQSRVFNNTLQTDVNINLAHRFRYVTPAKSDDDEPAEEENKDSDEIKF